MEDAGNPHRGFLDKMKKFFNRNSEDVTEEEAAAAAAIFRAACPGAELSVLSGGQPVYYYIISVE